MRKEHQVIIELITSYLEKNPSQRFGQALFNLRVNEFQNTLDPKYPNYTLRDIYNDDDQEIASRIQRQLDWFNLQKEVNSKISKASGLEGMTVNERLDATGLIEVFNQVKELNVEYAKYILRALKVDDESIT
ncbi:MAG: hypothetical protein ACRBG0_11800 [Lewinella sp.]|jgi:hypothetical protein|uniref:hypothetical protein n=1 Tax=Lewinella sp. TaxID=2004506 RepID=UPI003D6BF906